MLAGEIAIEIGKQVRGATEVHRVAGEHGGMGEDLINLCFA